MPRRKGLIDSVLTGLWYCHRRAPAPGRGTSINFSETIDLDTPITEADLEFIDDVMHEYGSNGSVLDICELDAPLTARVSGPEMVPPSSCSW
ncbi:hypothetical protein ACJJIF_06460 [Microbulbifer sp. SSSA002]|uniref:hypothetical protein n=1 Tax=unclassified Microbulbifer TaxID=2619833 RepID=UPI00403A78B3